MFVAASTECFPELPLVDAIERLRDLEFSSVVIAIHEDGNQLKPSFVAENVERAIGICRDTHRLDVAGYSLQFNSTGEELYREFEACCRLAKATKVASLTVPSEIVVALPDTALDSWKAVRSPCFTWKY